MPDYSLGDKIEKVVGEIEELHHDLKHLEIVIHNSNLLLVLATVLGSNRWATEEDVKQAYKVVELMESALAISGQKGGG